MAVQQVLRLGDPRLRLKAEPVRDFVEQEVTQTILDLQDTLRHQRQSSGYGRGIAAPQIGVPLRIIYLEYQGFTGALINPLILAASEEQIEVWDACLSFLCIFMKVWRFESIQVSYLDVQQQRQQLEAGPKDDLSELLQHEIDHLDGILCIDRVTDIQSVILREEFEARYRSKSPYSQGF